MFLNLLLLLALPLLACSPHALVQPHSWVAFYGTDAPPELLQDFAVIVVDSGFLGKVAPLKAKKSTVLAYISLGELNAQRAQFAEAQKMGLLVLENPNWPGAWMVDVRDPRWHALVVDVLASPLMARGFDGFFLDTVDSALNLEQQDPQKYKGMRAGVIQLIQRLHHKFPQAKLLMNGALGLVADLQAEVQMVAVESSLTDWNFQTKTPSWRKPDDRTWALNQMHKAKAANPHLQIFTLDYWNAADKPGVAAIYQQQRADGFIPYVATIGLDRIVPEPKVPPGPMPKMPIFQPQKL